MGYFLAAFKAVAPLCEPFEGIFRNLVPNPEQHIHARHTGDKSSYIINYSANKVIQDIEILGNDQASWLVLLGTPLLNLKSEQQKLHFLSDFLSNPIDLLRNKIDGNFAVLAYDETNQRFIAATDYNNTTPIFYSITPAGVLFSSHELALARFIQPEINPLGFFQSINLGVAWDSHTRFQNIHKTLPCQIIIVDDKKALRASQYWRPLDEIPWQLSFDQTIEKWLSTFKESIWNYFECSGGKPVLSDFTGGEDSRLIVAQCHALSIPFTAHVSGPNDSIDVKIAKQASRELGFDLIIRPMHYITDEQLLANATRISLRSDACQEFTTSCTNFATDANSSLDDYSILKYCGVPGGEAFRGSYYLRGKAAFPSKKIKLDYKFFTRMKYLLDFHAGLLGYSDNAGLEEIFNIVQTNLNDVEGFPIGTQIDHMLRVFQTCFLGLKYQNPLYLPFATKNMTRSIYSLPPRYKEGGRLTKACTEILYPELAFLKTETGVPTIRRTLLRQPLFLPEYISIMRHISSGALGRLLKWTRSPKWYYNQDTNTFIFTTLLNNPPYSDWFSSAATMKTGFLYNPDILNPVLSKARMGSCRFLPVLGRIVNQELACRWVYKEF